MAKCGRCRGRGFIKELHGLGIQECPGCTKGVKDQKASLGSNAVSVSVDGAACRVCNEPAVQSHHVIAQQRLNRYVLVGERQKAKGDRRNTVPLCFDCHAKVENGALLLAPHELPHGFATFVAEYDLYAALPRHLQQREVA